MAELFVTLQLNLSMISLPLKLPLFNICTIFIVNFRSYCNDRFYLDVFQGN